MYNSDCIHACVPEGHHHHQGCNEVDCLGPDHLTADSARPLLELLDAVVSVIPVPEWTGKVQILQCMNNLVGFELLLFKVSRDAIFGNNYCNELENGEYN